MAHYAPAWCGRHPGHRAVRLTLPTSSVARRRLITGGRVLALLVVLRRFFTGFHGPSESERRATAAVGRRHANRQRLAVVRTGSVFAPGGRSGVRPHSSSPTEKDARCKAR